RLGRDRARARPGVDGRWSCAARDRQRWRSGVLVGCLTTILGCSPAMEEEGTSTDELTAAAPPSANDVLAKLRTCRRASSSPFAKDRDDDPEIHVCKLTNAVFFKGDMDIDCDG